MMSDQIAEKIFATENTVSTEASSSASSVLSGANSLLSPRLNPACLNAAFYLQDPAAVARQLLGKLLVRRLDGRTLAGRIVETEAYLGKDDPAAHSFAGRTARNEVIFGPPGRAYVYLVYGMHHCLNVSCEPEGQAGCVLLRALEPVAGLDAMARLRGLPAPAAPRLLASGPGRLCQALAITRQAVNGADLASPDSPLRIIDDVEMDDGGMDDGVTVTPRIGIRKAAAMPLRFLVTGNRFVSSDARAPGSRS